MAKSQMIVQITVICGCGGVDNLATFYGGAPKDEHPGGVVPFIVEMTRRGWRELADDQWICPDCAANHPRFRKPGGRLQPVAAAV
jgi:hypothetical protein